MPLSVQTHYGTMYDAHNSIYICIYIYIYTRIQCIYICIYIYIFNAQYCQACTAGSTGSDSHPRTTISRVSFFPRPFYLFFFSLFHSFSFSFLHREKAKRLDLNDTSILKKRKKKLMPLLDKDV